MEFEFESGDQLTVNDIQSTNQLRFKDLTTEDDDEEDGTVCITSNLYVSTMDCHAINASHQDNEEVQVQRLLPCLNDKASNCSHCPMSSELSSLYFSR